MEKFPLARMKKIVLQELEDEVLVYDTSLNKALCLNGTSVLIWRMCDGKTSISEIAVKSSKLLEKPVSKEFVWLALDLLKKENLLEEGGEIDPEIDGVSRRELIRKVGFTSVIALPIVSSLVAPAATSAQSLNCNTAPFAPGCAFTVCITGAVPADPVCNNSCNNVAGNCNTGAATAMNCGPAPGNPSNQQCDCVCT